MAEKNGCVRGVHDQNPHIRRLRVRAKIQEWRAFPAGGGSTLKEF
jgi:hypothetical protein